MLRALILMALICVYCGLLPVAAAKTLSINRLPKTQSNDSTSATNTNVSPSVTTDEVIDSNNSQQESRYYHPAEDKKPRVVEQFNRQFLDGSYEYKYVLSNGVTRYEKSYWKQLENGKKLLARKGFYSHPLTNHKYFTVFYTADEHGFQQDTAKYTNVVPILPKQLDVPQQEYPHETDTIAETLATTTTTRKPKTTRKTTTRKPKTTTTKQPVAKPSKFNWIY